MRRVLVPTLLILFAEISGCSDQPVEASLAITDVTVIDGTDAPPILHATILIQGNRIADIRTGRVALSPDTPTLDGTGKYVIPGLWEMHMHVSLLEGPAILPVFTVYGITGVRDMGSPDSIFDIREELARGQRVGP
ncbi:MAG: putative amidohydrolase, partial [Thalassolituus oleivorans]